MVKKNIIVLYLIFGIIFLFGCVSKPITNSEIANISEPEISAYTQPQIKSQIYKNDEYGFSTNISKSWILLEVSGGLDIVKFESPDGEAVISVIYQSFEEIPFMETEEVVEQIIESITDIGAIQNEEVKRINKIPVHIVEILLEQDLKMKFAFFLAKSGLFITGYTAETNSAYQKYLDEFSNSINTFLIEEGAIETKLIEPLQQAKSKGEIKNYSPCDFLPDENVIPTEFRIKAPTEKNNTCTQSYNQPASYRTRFTVKIHKFDTKFSARQTYNNLIDKEKANRGYTLLEDSESCFSVERQGTLQSRVNLYCDLGYIVFEETVYDFELFDVDLIITDVVMNVVTKVVESGIV